MTPVNHFRIKSARGTFWLCAVIVSLVSPSVSRAQSTNLVSVTNQSLAELEFEMTNAFHRVAQIVNKPVRAFARTSNMKVVQYQQGWFHEGAHKPDFNAVDVRQTQELPYADKKYVTSDLQPNMVFLGAELEFNSMTKFFYTNRTLPKGKLTEAEMLQINELYRVIGKCERGIMRIKYPLPTRVSDPDAAPEVAAPEEPLSGLRSIPQEKRIFYGALAAGALVAFVLVLRLFRKKT